LLARIDANRFGTGRTIGAVMPAGSCQFIADARGSALALPRHTTLIMQRLGIRRRLRALVQTVAPPGAQLRR
jgi:hypothetical protein